MRLTSFLCMPFACLSLQSKKAVVPVVPKGKKAKKPVKQPEPESEEESSEEEELVPVVSAFIIHMLMTITKLVQLLLVTCYSLITISIDRVNESILHINFA